MAVKRITRRWLFNSFGVILVILAALVVAAAIGIREYFYNNVSQYMSTRMNLLSIQIDSLINDSSKDTNTEIRNIVANFSDKSRMELMAINASGEVTITSSGFASSGTVATPDYQQALLADNRTGQFQGVINEENVYSITKAAPGAIASEEFTALRLVSSLTRVDGQIWMIISTVFFLGAFIIFFVVLSSLYFINSIVVPLGEVGETAKHIAQGDFEIKLEKKNDDEIGDLVDVINYMAGELASSEKLKNDFISSVSHELRTPLTAIKGWGETVMDAGDDAALVQKGMKVIISETERLSSLVEELLDFSRMQSGRLTLMMTKLDIIAELSEAVLMFTERAKREGMALIYDEPDLFLAVVGDKNRLRQVFVNVIDNALKYSDSGDTITVSIEPEDNMAVIRVADTGCGIPAEDLPKIKMKFYKGNSTRRGSGIGLAVADEIVSMHGGTLSIDSVFEQGTTVTVRIPLSGKKNEGEAGQQPV